MIEQRRAIRFELQLPLELVRSGSLRLSSRGTTKNLSSAGVLFQSQAHVQIGSPVEYLITFPPGMGNGAPVLLHCIGKVVRMSDTTEYAATVERYEFVRESAQD